MDALKYFWSNYANFRGRTSRSDFWSAYLLNIMILLVLDQLAFVPYVNMIYSFLIIALIIPGIAIGFRRMHDVDKPGWYYFIPLYNFILATLSGDKKRNRYGQDPKLNETEAQKTCP